MNVIDMAQLEQVFRMIFEGLRGELGNKVEFQNVGYWDVSLKDSFERQAPSRELLSLGDLADAFEHTMDRDEDSQHLLTTLDSQYAIQVLRYLVWRASREASTTG